MQHPTSSRSRSGLPGLVLALSLLAAACGGSEGEAAEIEPTTTSRPTTTVPATTTTTEPPPASHLTGLAVEDGSVLARPAVVVKIGSDLAARPQVGLSVADVVLEEIVEGGISRFVAVFQSSDSDPVGPIRSARTSEVDLLPLFGRPVFVSSGGNAGTMRRLREADVAVLAGHDSPYGSLFFRDRTRPGTHNLFTETSAIREAASESAQPPEPLFVFREPGTEPPRHALPVIGVDIDFGSTRTRWVRDTERSSFLRWQDRTVHLDPDDVQIGVTNLVVLATTYRTSPADPRSPDAVSVGSGDAWVLTDGYVVAGSWERPTPDSRYILRGPDGEEIALTPGRTWIALPRPGGVSFLDTDPR